MSEQRYLWAEANAVATELANAIRPGCLRIEIAGSLRRRKDTVGDIEILYVPRMQWEPNPEDLFAEVLSNLADGRIEGLERSGELTRHLNALGHETYGEHNKLMRHVATGIPVDLFATTTDAWYNYLVCRTGPAESNVRICQAAIARGCRWKPYSPGFETPDGVQRMDSERAVFEFVGLPYHEPEGRT